MLRVVVEEGGRPWMDILSKKTAKQIYKMESESGRKTQERKMQKQWHLSLAEEWRG